MMTREDILLVLEIIEEKHGPGYSDDPKIGALQAKLSIMLQMKSDLTERTVG